MGQRVQEMVGDQELILTCPEVAACECAAPHVLCFLLF